MSDSLLILPPGRGVRDEWHESTQDLERARIMLSTAQTTEKLVIRQFADGLAAFADLREAIRHAAIAEKIVEDFTSIEANLRRLADPEKQP